jgi:hypothetical protein
VGSVSEAAVEGLNHIVRVSGLQARRTVGLEAVEVHSRKKMREKSRRSGLLAMSLVGEGAGEVDHAVLAVVYDTAGHLRVLGPSLEEVAGPVAEIVLAMVEYAPAMPAGARRPVAPWQRCLIISQENHEVLISRTR